MNEEASSDDGSAEFYGYIFSQVVSYGDPFCLEVQIEINSHLSISLIKKGAFRGSRRTLFEIDPDSKVTGISNILHIDIEPEGPFQIEFMIIHRNKEDIVFHSINTRNGKCGIPCKWLNRINA